MKEEKGITLTSLVIYVIVMIIVIGVMSSITNNFYNNTGDINATVQEIVEFNKFNTYFLKEVKLNGNAVDKFNEAGEKPYILFASGNSFMFSDNKIYYNDIEICKNVTDASFELVSQDIDDNENAKSNETIIRAELNFENYSKSINYKIESIY